ncbi:MAG: alpha/beta hydrolase family protein [Acidimicrobiia bacterium]
MSMRRLGVALTVGVLVLSACSSSKSATSSTAKVSVSGTPAEPAFAKRGPFAAGVTTLQMGDRKVEVWYPVAPKSVAGKVADAYSITTWLPATVVAKIPADQQAKYVTKAYRNAPAAAGQFPLVVFSHGVLSFRDQSTFLTDHLASWGMVVMAPDHLERGIATIFEPSAKPVDDVGDLKRTIDLGLAEDGRAGSILQGRIDEKNIGAVGHSAGGAAVLKLGETDPRVKVVVSLTTPLLDAANWPAGKPVMFIAGSADQIIPSQSVVDSYNALTNAPKRLVLIMGAGHLAFSEICEIGKERGGILKIAQSNGVALSDQVIRLGSDGCNPPDVAPTAAWPVIDNFTTAQLANTFRLDRTPIGLGDGVQNQFPGVQVQYQQAS